ncbi:MAG: tRNA lysidine(34) synthetase TilS [Chromatiales bacterium 21-64-14]|nr:MAG: tRNA lysidine(34) synthetase TilS [Chromatiales bacterium 21-64-14]HQU15127.1 tRNA lysidine(34) synthetase TilS [Gammaproteobacteria bacterium]
MEFDPHALLRALAGFPPARGHWVAYSGGLDSLVLLHALATGPARGAVAGLRAVHVNHGLQPDAAAWEMHGRAVCAALGVPFRALSVDGRPRPGESPEAAARRARYGALITLVEPGDLLLTAHHQDDQAETVLLQLLRGAGPAGLAGMAACAPFGAGWLARPLLGFRRESLHRYALAHGLSWVEDGSNRDLRLDRNFLRHEILPALRQRWPSCSRTLSRAASHAAEAATVLEYCGDQDLASVAEPGDKVLRVSRLRALAPARRRNALRAWFRTLGLPAPSTAHLERCLTEALDAGPDRNPRVHWPGAEVRRYRDRLYAMAPLPVFSAACRQDWDLDTAVELPGALGTLRAVPCTGGGLRLADCHGQAATVGFRAGGEGCRPAPGAPTRALKKLFQERGVPPWARSRIPLVYLDGVLAAVADWWVCAPFQADAGEAGRAVSWTRGPGAGGVP